MALSAVHGCEAVAERVHVAVGAHAGVAEEVPRAAEVVAAFEDGVAAAGAELLEVVAGPDAGDPRSDHEHVDVFDGHGSEATSRLL